MAALSTLCTRDYANVTGKNPTVRTSGRLGHCRPEKGTFDLPRAAWRPLPPLHRSLPGPRGTGDRPVFLAVYPLVSSVSRGPLSFTMSQFICLCKLSFLRENENRARKRPVCYFLLGRRDSYGTGQGGGCSYQDRPRCWFILIP